MISKTFDTCVKLRVCGSLSLKGLLFLNWNNWVFSMLLNKVNIKSDFVFLEKKKKQMKISRALAYWSVIMVIQNEILQ